MEVQVSASGRGLIDACYPVSLARNGPVLCTFLEVTAADALQTYQQLTLMLYGRSFGNTST